MKPLSEELTKLTFPDLIEAPNGECWDLRMFLYKGASEGVRLGVLKRIEAGKFGEITPERIPVILGIHEYITAHLVKGGASTTAHAILATLKRFFVWVDQSEYSVSIQTLGETYLEWTENLLFRLNVERSLSNRFVMTEAHAVGRVFDAVLVTSDAAVQRRKGGLFRWTRLKTQPTLKKDLSKQNLEQAAVFGSFLISLAGAMTFESICGELPILLKVSSGKELSLPLRLVVNPKRESLAGKVRMAIDKDANCAGCPLRRRLLNLRVEAEYLIFIGQTGMNATQVQKLERGLRYRSVNDEFDVYKVFKGRRSGNALFRVYKDYRPWLAKYEAWLDETGLSGLSNLLFPFLDNGGNNVCDPDQFREPQQIIRLCKRLDIQFVAPRTLRNTRQNWLLRMTGDAEVTAAMGAHTKQVLLNVYERPNHQRATAEVGTYFKAINPVEAPGPGLCVDSSHEPKPEEHIPHSAPRPDCISPDGCLFCDFHRDVLTPDYVWKLASHAHIKFVELGGYKGNATLLEEHPCEVVISRIRGKLDLISKRSEICNTWVVEAKERIREGRYHPHWQGFIELMEAGI